MAPSALLLVLLLLPLCPAPACQVNSSNLSCQYNYNRRINCTWTTDSTDVCSVQAHNFKIFKTARYFTDYSSPPCTLEPTGTPSLRTCSLLFDQTVKDYDVLSLKLSCVHMPLSLVTQYKPACHVKLDALDAPMVNGSRISWKKPPVSKRSLQCEYQWQWTLQHHPWAGSWSTDVQRKCADQCGEELQADTLFIDQKYRARVRVQVAMDRLGLPEWCEWKQCSQWSEWSPTLSWVSAVGRIQKRPQHESERARADGAGLWKTVSLVAFLLGLIIVSLWTSRVHWVYMMKVFKGATLSSRTPSVLKMGWERPLLFSSDSYLTFFNPGDIIASVELISLEPRPGFDCLLPPDENPSSPVMPLCSNLSSFSNPMYSNLCPQHAPQPNPDPNSETDDPQGDTGLEACPELDQLLLLGTAQQSQGLPVVCEYERVEAVGAQGSGGDSDWGPAGKSGDRVRLTSVDSGVGSGEEVSQDSLHLEDHNAVRNVFH